MRSGIARRAGLTFLGNLGCRRHGDQRLDLARPHRSNAHRNPCPDCPADQCHRAFQVKCIDKPGKITDRIVKRIAAENLLGEPETAHVITQHAIGLRKIGNNLIPAIKRAAHLMDKDDGGIAFAFVCEPQPCSVCINPVDCVCHAMPVP